MKTRELLDYKYANKEMKTVDYKQAKISDDPKTFVEGYVNRVAENSMLISKYPFLLPLDYQGKVPKDYDFTFTEIDMLPRGWRNLMIDMSAELLAYFHQRNIDPYTFHIDQLKEKWSQIRLYYSLHCDDKYTDEGIDEIIQKYEELSEHTCCECGKEATLMSRGWICPYCKDCAVRLKTEEGKRWDFAPLEKSTWTKIKDSQIFSYGEMKNEAQADSHQ